jgi:hypothetical protein
VQGGGMPFHYFLYRRIIFILAAESKKGKYKEKYFHNDYLGGENLHLFKIIA